MTNEELRYFNKKRKETTENILNILDGLEYAITMEVLREIEIQIREKSAEVLRKSKIPTKG